MTEVSEVYDESLLEMEKARENFNMGKFHDTFIREKTPEEVLFDPVENLDDDSLTIDGAKEATPLSELKDQTDSSQFQTWNEKKKTIDPYDGIYDTQLSASQRFELLENINEQKTDKSYNALDEVVRRLIGSYELTTSSSVYEFLLLLCQSEKIPVDYREMICHSLKVDDKPKYFYLLFSTLSKGILSAGYKYSFCARIIMYCLDHPYISNKEFSSKVNDVLEQLAVSQNLGDIFSKFFADIAYYRDSHSFETNDVCGILETIKHYKEWSICARNLLLSSKETQQPKLIKDILEMARDKTNPNRSDSADILIHFPHYQEELGFNPKDVGNGILRILGSSLVVAKNKENVHTDSFVNSCKDSIRKMIKMTRSDFFGKSVDPQFPNGGEPFKSMDMDHLISFCSGFLEEEYDDSSSTDSSDWAYFSLSDLSRAMKRVQVERSVCTVGNEPLYPIHGLYLVIICSHVSRKVRDIASVRSRLIQELTEAEGTCSTGYFVRITNALVGILPGFEMKISIQDSILSVFADKMEKIIKEGTGTPSGTNIYEEMLEDSPDKMIEYNNLISKHLPTVRQEMWEQFREDISDIEFDEMFNSSYNKFMGRDLSK